MNGDQTEMKEMGALKIIQALADGVNPYTGEVLPTDSVLQNPQIIRALFTAIEALKAEMKRQERTRNLPQRAGQPWTEQELSLLGKRFDQGLSISDIAREHKRTSGAIKAQLERLGKIPR